MRTVFYSIILATFTITLSIAQKKAIIYGKISNYTDNSDVRASYTNNHIERTWIDFKGKIDKKGNYKIVCWIDKLQPLVVNIGDKYAELYLEPGDSLNMSTDYKDFYVKIKFSGKGCPNNDLKSTHYKTFGNVYYDQDFNVTIMPKMKDVSPEVFTAFMDSVSKHYMGFLERHKTELTPAFYEYSKVITYYNLLYMRLLYPFVNLQQKVDKNVKNSFSQYIPYLSFLDSETMVHDSLLSNYNYVKCVNLYCHIKIALLYSSLVNVNTSKEDPMSSTSLRDYYLRKSLLWGKTRDYIQTESISYAFYREGVTARQQLMSLLKEDIKDSTFIGIAERMAEKNKDRKDPLVVGQQFPDFAMKDINGETVSLESLKGKVVYVDFWGSWCGPCMAEMAPAKALKEKLKDKKGQIVYLYIASDSEAPWKKAIEKNGIEGVHIRIQDRESLGNFGVSYFPTYFLLDKSSKIVSKDMRPSNEKITDLILSTLEQ